MKNIMCELFDKMEQEALTFKNNLIELHEKMITNIKDSITMSQGNVWTSCLTI